MAKQNIYPIDGIRMSAVSAGIKKPGKVDVVLFEICAGASVAGVYTQNAFCAAPVVIARRHNEQNIEQQGLRYFLINTGNANAGTGESGIENALSCCAALGRDAGVDTTSVLPFSTGVIGEPLPVEKIIKVLPQALDNLSEASWSEAARGIMTTDTVPKSYSRQISIAGRKISISGISKGAGMIKPNMATMLGFIFTDLQIDRKSLHELNQAAANRSFNRITVDGDTSTNDCCMLTASGKSGLVYGELDETGQEAFGQALQEVYDELAQAIIRDGEGASKFVTVEVSQGQDENECLQIAYTIAESPLVKTALFASDPNWGRILAAVGRAGIHELDVSKIAIYLDDVCIVQNGGRSPTYTEAMGQAVMDKAEFTISIQLGRGQASAFTWTCDLSYDYVRINAEYRS